MSTARRETYVAMPFFPLGRVNPPRYTIALLVLTAKQKSASYTHCAPPLASPHFGVRGPSRSSSSSYGEMVGNLCVMNSNAFPARRLFCAVHDFSRCH